MCENPVNVMTLRVNGLAEDEEVFTFDASEADTYGESIKLCATFETKVTITDIYMMMDPPMDVTFTVEDVAGNSIDGVSQTFNTSK